MSTVKLLMIEDNPGDVVLIEKMLAEKAPGVYQLRKASYLKSGLEMIRSVNPDVLLLDLTLPDSRGLDALQIIVKAAPHLPVIVLTGIQDEEIATTAMKMGAQDYLVKNEVNGPVIIRSIRYAIERKQIETELRAAQERFRTIVEDQTEMICRFHPDFQLTFLNQAFCREFQKKPNDLLGTPFWALIPETEREKVMGLIGQIDPYRPHVVYEYAYKHNTHKITWQQWGVRGLFNERGTLYEFQAVGRDITELKKVEEALQQANAALKEQAIRDGLTGLFNRRYMEETLRRELFRARRNRTPVGIMLLDIDHFKMVNDRYGHAAGDEALRELGALLIKRTRAGDVACRYGGEEFVLILPGANLEQTKARAEEIRLEVKSLRPTGIRGNLTISTGVVVFPHHGLNADELLLAADNALYTAKDKGRDCVVIGKAKIEEF